MSPTPPSARLRSLASHWLSLWILLSIPALLLTAQAVQGAPAGKLLHTTGELSVRLLVLALAVTPLRMLFASHRWPRWLLARRRTLGVASFGYGALHLVFYAWHEGLLTDALLPSILTGWLALLVMVPPALTSTDSAVRRLGRRWKTVQQLAHLAPVLAAAHWWLLDGAVGPVLVHFLPLLALQLYRLTRRPRGTGGGSSPG